MITLYKTPERMKELIKTMPKPIFHLVENKNGVSTVLKNKDGVVEYVYKGENYLPGAKNVASRKYSDCLSLLIDLKNIKAEL